MHKSPIARRLCRNRRYMAINTANGMGLQNTRRKFVRPRCAELVKVSYQIRPMGLRDVDDNLAQFVDGLLLGRIRRRIVQLAFRDGDCDRGARRLKTAFFHRGRAGWAPCRG